MKHKNKQTKFPVARIKKIMQKDEEVGKVAQATPVVISKALELFLGLIVDEASKVTMERGSKKVEAYHLKHAVETTEILDFLKEIVEGVADPSAGGTIDLESENAEAKKRRGKGKKTAVAGDGPVKKRRKKKDGQEAEGEGDVDMRSEPEPDQDEEEEEEPKPKKPRKRPAKNPKPKSSSNGKEDEWQEDKPFMPRS